MKRYIAFIFLLCFSSAYAKAPTFRSLEPTPIKLEKVDKYDVVYFKGKIQITGNFMAGWEKKGFSPYKLIVSFYPSKESAGFLPFPKGEQPPNVIIFSNAKEAAKLLLSPEEYAALMSEENKYTERELIDGANLKTYKGFSTVTVDKYSTAVDCGSRWYKVRLISVEPFNGERSANSWGPLPC